MTDKPTTKTKAKPAKAAKAAKPDELARGLARVRTQNPIAGRHLARARAAMRDKDRKAAGRHLAAAAALPGGHRDACRTLAELAQ